MARCSGSAGGSTRIARPLPPRWVDRTSLYADGFPWYLTDGDDRYEPLSSDGLAATNDRLGRTLCVPLALESDDATQIQELRDAMSHSTSESKPDTLITSGPVEPPRTGPGNSSELPPAQNRLAAALRNKAMLAPLFWSVIGRFPLYLVTLALVVFTTSRGTGYGSTGLLLACFTLGTAAFAPFVARRVDVYGQPPLLLITGVVHPLALIGFVSTESTSLATQLACVTVAGATIPPISGCVRSLWSALDSTRQVGFSLEAVLSEIFVIVGPVLLSIVLFWGSPATAVILGGMLAGAGAIGLATTRASRTWRATTSERNPLGALRSAGLVRLLIVLICAAVSMGVFNIALPAFAHDHGSTDSVGLIFGAWGVGGILGGLWYGGRTLRWPAELTFAVGLLILSAFTTLPLLAWDNWSMGVALALHGVVIAPVTAISYELVARTARSDTVTEAFSWAITVNIVGTAVGCPARRPPHQHPQHLGGLPRRGRRPAYSHGGCVCRAPPVREPRRNLPTIGLTHPSEWHISAVIGMENRARSSDVLPPSRQRIDHHYRNPILEVAA